MCDQQIKCEKYNYTLEERYQNQTSYTSQMTLSKNKDELLVFIFKPQGRRMYSQNDCSHRHQEVKSARYNMDKHSKFLAAKEEEYKQLQLNENFAYERIKSKTSTPIKDISAFLFGPSGSRFWLLRKHIISMKQGDILKGLQFYSWQCITLMLKEGKQANFVIQDESQMQLLVRYLLLALRSIDGQRGTLDDAIVEKFKKEGKIDKELLSNLREKYKKHPWMMQKRLI